MCCVCCVLCVSCVCCVLCVRVFRLYRVFRLFVVLLCVVCVVCVCRMPCCVMSCHIMWPLTVRTERHRTSWQHTNQQLLELELHGIAQYRPSRLSPTSCAERDHHWHLNELKRTEACGDDERSSIISRATRRRGSQPGALLELFSSRISVDQDLSVIVAEINK